MVTIVYEGKTFTVPENWNEVTLGDYETFYKLKPETARERVELVAKIVKVDSALLLSWPAEVFNRIVDTISFIFEDTPLEANPAVVVDGVTYLVSVEDDISLGAWVDAEEVQKTGEAVLSNVLAIVCRPPGEAYNYRLSEQRQKMFAALPMSQITGVLGFFLQCRNELDKLIEAYTKARQIASLLPPSIKHFQKPGAGTKLSRIWLTVKYWFLTRLLNYRLRKLSLSYNIAATKA